MILQNIVLTLILSGCVIKNNLHLLLCLKKTACHFPLLFFSDTLSLSHTSPTPHPRRSIAPLSTGEIKALWDWLHSAALVSS